MATKNNPGAFRCYEAALPDEPFFTILARDPAAPATLEFWAAERIKRDKNHTQDDKERIVEALDDAKDMMDWREKNLDPVGDGVPSWRIPRQIMDDGPAICEKAPDAFQAFRDDVTELLRKITVGLRQVTDDMDHFDGATTSFQDRINGYALELEQFIQGRPVGKSLPPNEDPLLLRLSHAVLKLHDGRLPRPHDLYRAVKYDSQPGWKYECIGIGSSDLVEIERRLRNQFQAPDNGCGEPDPGPVVDSEPEDLAHAPEVPHHRFSVFNKGEHYAYARGLEVSPQHLPTALDAMEESGWSLLAIFGQTDAQHIGFIFKRTYPPVAWIPPMFENDIRDIKVDPTFRSIYPADNLGRGQEP